MKKQDTSKLSKARPISIKEKPVLLGFAIQSKRLDGQMRLRILWGRLILSFFAVTLAGWLLFAAGLFAFFKYKKEFAEVSFADMMFLPVKIEEHRKKMGNYHIDQGIALIKEGDYRDGLRLLRLGVARAPDNLEGRRLVAEFFEIALKRPDKAAQMMLTGIQYDGIEDIAYIKSTIRLLLRYQMDDEIQELADTYLPDDAEITDRNQVLAFGAANANYLRGNYDRADDYLLSYKMLDSLEGLLLASQISWDRGNKKSAILMMESSLDNFPNSEPLLMQLSRYNREIGDIEKARRYAILRNVTAPLSPAPRLELLYIYNKSGDTEREERETQRMLKQFRDDEQALQALANFAADTGNIELARRTYEVALENEFTIDAFALLLIESHLVATDYEGAISFAEELIKEKPAWLSKRSAIFQSLRSVASYGVNRPDLGEIYLQDFINESQQPASFLAVARRFNNIDRQQQARKVLAAAYQEAPTNQKVLTELIRVELSLGNTENLSNLLTRFLQMRRPRMDILQDAYDKLGSDRFIFTPDRENLLLQLSAILREKEQRTLNAS